jgi:hypothetical protein
LELVHTVATPLGREGADGQPKNKQDDKPYLLTSGTLDTGGRWFVAVALFAVLAAAIIVYCTTDSVAL